MLGTPKLYASSHPRIIQTNLYLQIKLLDWTPSNHMCIVQKGNSAELQGQTQLWLISDDAMFTKLQFSDFVPFNKSCFTKNCKAHSPTCLNIMCHNRKVSSSVSSICEATATPPIELPYRQNKFFQISVITTKTPLVAFEPEFVKVICRPLPTKTLYEIRFFKSKTYQSISQTRMVPSCIYSRTSPIPLILHGVLPPPRQKRSPDWH